MESRLGKCSYCKNPASMIRFIMNRREHICSSRVCDLKSKIKHGLYVENRVKI